MWSPFSILDCMSKDEFIEWCDQLRHFITPNALSPNCSAVSAEKILPLALYFLKNLEPSAMASNAFGVHLNTVKSCVSMQVSLFVKRPVHDILNKWSMY